MKRYDVYVGGFDDNEAIDFNESYDFLEQATEAMETLAEHYDFVDIWEKTSRPNGTAYSNVVAYYRTDTIKDPDGTVYKWNDNGMYYEEV